MLQDSIPLTTKAPFTIEIPPESSAPALLIRNWGSGPDIKFEGRDNSNQGQIGNDGRHLDAAGNERPTSGSQFIGGGDSEVFAGRVIGGSGATYQMNLSSDDGTTFLGGGSPTVFTVKQLQIDPAATIPVGTWALVGKRGGKYFMQAPVWLS